MGAVFFDPPRFALYKVYGPGVELGAGGDLLFYGGYMYNVSDPYDLVGENPELGADASLGTTGLGVRLIFTGDPFEDPWAWMIGWAWGAKFGASGSYTTTELLPWPP